jgi:hypothetical protein
MDLIIAFVVAGYATRERKSRMRRRRYSSGGYPCRRNHDWTVTG